MVDPSGATHAYVDPSPSISEPLPRQYMNAPRPNPTNSCGNCAGCPNESGVYATADTDPNSDATRRPSNKFRTWVSPLGSSESGCTYHGPTPRRPLRQAFTSSAR